MFIRETCWLWGAEPVTSCRCGHPPGGAIRALCVFISAHFLCGGAAEEGKDQIGWLADNTDAFGFKKNKQLLNLWPLKAFRTKTWFHLITSWFSLVQTLLNATRPMRWIQFSPPLVLHRTRRRWLISSGWLVKFQLDRGGVGRGGRRSRLCTGHFFHTKLGKLFFSPAEANCANEARRHSLKARRFRLRLTSCWRDTVPSGRVQR